MVEDALLFTQFAIDRMSDEAYWIDRDACFIYANDAACRNLGYSREELLGMSVHDIDPNFPAEAWPAHWQQLQEHGSLVRRSLHRTKDGRLFPVEITANYLEFDGDGYNCTFARDISLREETEAVLRRHMRHLEALRQVGLEITSRLEPDLVLHSIVERAIELLGGQSGGFYRCCPERDVLEWVVAIGPDVAPAGTTLRRGEGLSGKVWEKGEPLYVEDYQAWVGKAKVYDGHTFRSVIGVPVWWGPAGSGAEFLGVLNVLSDVPAVFSSMDMELLILLAAQAAIALKNAQLFEAERAARERAETGAAELRARERNLRLLNDITRTALEVSDIQAVLQHSADRLCELLEADGCSIALWDASRQAPVAAAASGPVFKDYAQFEVRPGEMTMTEAVLSAGQPLAIEDLARESLVSERIAARFPIRSVLALPLRASGEKLGAAFIVFETPHHFDQAEITQAAQTTDQVALAVAKARLLKTEREQRALAEALREETQAAYEELKRTQAQLLQSARMAAIGQLAAGVAHELNNPLTSVLGYAELLSWDIPPEDPVAADLLVILEEARRARDIVRDLLAFSRQTESVQEDEEINAVVRGVVSLLRSQVEGGDIVIEETYVPGLPPLPLARGRMQQVFLNLLNNAVQAMPQGGRLTVRSERVGSEVAISIGDTGVGLPEHLLPRIFEPFFTTKPVGQGTGLGLSVSLGIVEEHGGRIEVESREGVGSTFTVWLPLERTSGEANDVP